MYARYYEQQKNFRQRVEEGETDIVFVALAEVESVYAACANALRDQYSYYMNLEDAKDKESLGLQALEASRLGKQVQELEDKYVGLVKRAYILMGDHPDWIFQVPNREIGLFHVKSMERAVEELLPFILLHNKAASAEARAFLESDLRRRLWSMVTPTHRSGVNKHA